jgi:peptidyl-Lys metalloendopeptidase
MRFTARLAGLGLFALPFGAAFAAQPLAVDIMPASDAKATGGFLGAIEFTMRNTSAAPVRVLKYQTPFFGVEADLFRVSLGKDEVPYVGMLVKRGRPTATDYLTIAPGEALSATVDLSAYYDLAKSGQYLVQYDTLLQDAEHEGRPLEKGAGVPLELQSAPVSLWIDGSDLFLDKSEPFLPYGMLAKATPRFESCSTTRQSALNTALSSARGYSQNSANYLNAGNRGARYTTWFGTYSSGRYATVDSHFDAIDYALDNAQITFNCSCTQSYYAYVYPSQPYRIYLCNAFWSAPNTGTDSRAGTLVHEMSHFDVVANTDDLAYGQTACKNLARSQPSRAVRNADSHEYFGENTPFQN